MRACLIFSTTEARPRDQLVNVQVGYPNIQDKSMTSKNGNATKTGQRILRAETFEY